MKDDRKVLGLQSEWAIFGDMWRDFIWANVKPSFSMEGMDVFKKMMMTTTMNQFTYIRIISHTNESVHQQMNQFQYK